mmetsp:Transcript_50636/g.119824  ORF Transcript_50636/g.119824 Transcript_50636/m.119824 type:complete len:222 (-) Transcript_50636:876-1541(-)
MGRLPAVGPARIACPDPGGGCGLGRGNEADRKPALQTPAIRVIRFRYPRPPRPTPPGSEKGYPGDSRTLRAAVLRPNVPVGTHRDGPGKLSHHGPGAMQQRRSHRSHHLRLRAPGDGGGATADAATPGRNRQRRRRLGRRLFAGAEGHPDADAEAGVRDEPNRQPSRRWVDGGAAPDANGRVCARPSPPHRQPRHGAYQLPVPVWGHGRPRRPPRRRRHLE